MSRLSLAQLFSRPAPSAELPATRGLWRKFDLIHALADIHGYRSFLEISTSRSGGSYPLMDQSRFQTCQRLSYYTPNDWTDGAPIDYRSLDGETADGMRRIREQGSRFDIVFVDAWHEYETSRRDLDDALELLARNGVVVIHDCLPDDEDLCSPLRGDRTSWCGVSYKVYVDLLSSRRDLWFCTVDTDYGCGMIRKRRAPGVYRRGTGGDPKLIRGWRSLGSDFKAAYRYYDHHKKDLMNVVTVEQFLAAEQERARFQPWRLFS